jgi:DNA-binding MarR family transcriptional regulator
MVEEYQVRRVLFEYVQRPESTISDIARALGMREDDVHEVIRDYFGGE